MKRIWGLTIITLRNAVRSRVVAILLLTLIIVILGMPLAIRGDGTASSHVQILITYTLGFAAFLLAMSTLWAGCSAVSTEIQRRQIQLIVTKPVRGYELWLGKWIGLLLLNALFLALAGLMTYASLHGALRSGRFDPEERERVSRQYLVAQYDMRPAETPTRDQAEEQVRTWRQEGRIPAGEDRPDLAVDLLRSLQRDVFSVAPGEQQTWTFPLPRGLSDRPLYLRYRFSGSALGLEPVRGVWTVRGAGDEPLHSETADIIPTVTHTLEIPAGVRDGSDTLTITFAHIDEEPTTVFFNPSDGLMLMVYHGRFEPNLGRALLIVFAHLAFLAAIGVTAGSIFSMPVAALTAVYLLVVMQSGRLIHALAARESYFAHGPEPAAWTRAADALLNGIYRMLDLLVQPLQSANVLEWVSTGRLVSWFEVLRVCGVQFVLYSAILLLIGGWCLSKRELALPDISS